MPKPEKAVGLVLGLVAVAIFGGSLPATRFAVAGLDPWFVTAGRAAIAGIVGIGLLAAERPRFPTDRIGTLVLIALCLIVGFPAMLAIASVDVPSSHGGIVLGLLPLATMVGAVALAGERHSPAFWGLSLIGAGLVVAFALRDGDAAIVTGDVFLGVAVILTGIGYTLAGMLSRIIRGWQVIAWALAITMPAALAATAILWPADAAVVPASAWAGLIYGGVMTQFVAYSLWNMALALGGVARIGQLQLLQPFVTFAIAAVLLGETITVTMAVFALAVVAVVALGRRTAVRSMAEPAKPAGA